MPLLGEDNGRALVYLWSMGTHPWEVAVAALVVGACLGASGCWLQSERLTNDKCEKWSAHFREVLTAQADTKLSACGTASPSDARERMRARFRQDIAAAGDSTLAACIGTANEKRAPLPNRPPQGPPSYRTAEADCFMKGKSPKQWRHCDFFVAGPLAPFALTAASYETIDCAKGEFQRAPIP